MGAWQQAPPRRDVQALLRDLAFGLKRLGFTQREGEERVAAAVAALLAERGAGLANGLARLDEEAILGRALRG